MKRFMAQPGSFGGERLPNTLWYAHATGETRRYIVDADTGPPPESVLPDGNDPALTEPRSVLLRGLLFLQVACELMGRLS